MIRAHEKAGAWYPTRAADLAALVDGLVARASAAWANRPTPGAPPPPPPAGMPLAGIVPHAGLAYSGPTAARVYAWLAEALPALDVGDGGDGIAFAVFGAAHRTEVRRPALWARGAWRTPLGDLRVDEEWADSLLFGSGGLWEDRPAAHAGDNAIELQTPFLARLFPKALILPVALGPAADAAEAGRFAAKTAAALGKNAIALGSTDLTHYGAHFDLAPAGTGPEALRWAEENDRPFLDALVRLDLARIVPAGEAARTICGAGAAAAAAGFAAERGAQSGVLLAHASSRDLDSNDPADHFVNYGAVAYAAESTGQGVRP